ncbi:MAG: PLP-dependent aminotransferase family protein [Staphylococcus pseudoxylosus]|uniref:aminotransferase-like domain-containing protein n=1 Tax=Staphylococcus pseudoxylosus TaxID=2282419 RepID=UPI0031F71074
MIKMKYKEVASYIRNNIISGDWFYDMRIPSHRELAKQFKVNRVTVIKSIEILEIEGFVYTKKGSGTYVNDYLDESFIQNKWNEMMEWSSRTRSQYTVQLINKLETNDDYIHISKGELGKDLIPDIKLRNAMRKVSGYVGDLSFGYNNGYGYIKLRELIAQRLRDEGMNINSKNVLITSGALHAIQLLVIGFLSQNTYIFSNTPSYIDSTHVFNVLNMKNVKLTYNEINDFKNVLNNYSRIKDKALYIESNFNNPTGKSITKESREQIIKISKQLKLPIIEDDIYKDIWFDEIPLESLKSLDTNGNVIHISSFSKSIAPAIRIGWAIASEKVIEQLADIRMQIDYGSSILSQMVVYELLKSGDYDSHVERLRLILKDKRDYMTGILEENFSEVATWEAPKGGFFIWVNFNTDINIRKLFSKLIEKEKILINPGYIYGSEENTVRFSFAYESRKNIKYTLIKIKKYIKDSSK